MKLAQSHIWFLGGVLVWIVLLQGVMLWFLSFSPSFICNNSGAWPLSQVPVFGNVFLVFFLALALGAWAWKQIPTKKKAYIICWALVVGAGFSHALERIMSGCVLDYWHLKVFGQTLYFNLGDISLTIGVLFFVGVWLWEQRRKT